MTIIGFKSSSLCINGLTLHSTQCFVKDKFVRSGRRLQVSIRITFRLGWCGNPFKDETSSLSRVNIGGLWR
jgi:hypothetical protein